MTMICPKSWFLILKHATLKEKEVESQRFRGEPTFPIECWNVYNRHVVRCQEQKTGKRFL